MQLEDFGRHNLGAATEFSGQAMARLHLTGSGSDVQGLEGQGSIEVPSGKMYNLPVLLDLLKLLGLRAGPHGLRGSAGHVRHQGIARHGPPA